MKNIKISIFLLFLSSNTLFAQEFLGVKVDGNKDSVIKIFQSKGFIKIKEEWDSTMLHGRAGNKEVELNIVFTPISKVAFQYVVTLPEQTNWNALRNEFDDYLHLLTEKYGAPEVKNNMLDSPFKEGDGNEMQALIKGKCNYLGMWKNEDLVIFINYEKTANVVIGYTNPKNKVLYEQEVRKINKEAF